VTARSPAVGGSGSIGLPPAAEVIELALSLSSADDAVVIVEDSSEADVRFANNTTTTNGIRRDRRVTVVSFLGTAAGVASRSGAFDIASLVETSEVAARSADPAEDAAPLIEGGPEDPAFTAAAPDTDLAALDGVVSSLADTFARARSAGLTLAGFATHEIETTSLGSSRGLRLRYVQPTGFLDLAARSADGTRSAWVGLGTASFEGVEIPPLYDRLVTRLAWAERLVDLPPGRYETILPPESVADLMLVLSHSLSGRDAEDGRSAFSAPGGGTRIGEALAERPFRLFSDPSAPGLECAPFLAAAASSSDVSVFDNGLPIGRTAWVQDGRLAALEYHRAGAARAGAVATAAADNLILELPGATDSLDDLVARTDRALLLTCLWYIREVDPVTLLVTGLTRDGVYLVEKGEVVGAVNNFRFNESPLAVLARATDVSATVRALSREWGEYQSRTSMPALRVADFNMSSVSPAT
jgi:predicted Zn-dependent protease